SGAWPPDLSGEKHSNHLEKQGQLAPRVETVETRGSIPGPVRSGSPPPAGEDCVAGKTGRVLPRVPRPLELGPERSLVFVNAVLLRRGRTSALVQAWDAAPDFSHFSPGCPMCLELRSKASAGLGFLT